MNFSISDKPNSNIAETAFNRSKQDEEQRLKDRVVDYGIGSAILAPPAFLGPLLGAAVLGAATVPGGVFIGVGAAACIALQAGVVEGMIRAADKDYAKYRNLQSYLASNRDEPEIRDLILFLEPPTKKRENDLSAAKKIVSQLKEIKKNNTPQNILVLEKDAAIRMLNDKIEILNTTTSEVADYLSNTDRGIVLSKISKLVSFDKTFFDKTESNNLDIIKNAKALQSEFEALKKQIEDL